MSMNENCLCVLVVTKTGVGLGLDPAGLGLGLGLPGGACVRRRGSCATAQWPVLACVPNDVP